MPTMTRIEQQTLVRGFPRHRYRVASEYIPTDLEGYPFGILDVGGFRDNPVVREIFPGVEAIAINIPHEYHGRTGNITYDGRHIPLATDSIPVVMAVDVLEHVRREERFFLLQEMLRVAGQKVVVSGPFDSVQNVKYEVEFLKTLDRYGLPPKASILQHRKRGLSKIEELVLMARNLRTPFAIYPATIADLDFQGLLSQAEVLGGYEGNTKSRFPTNTVFSRVRHILEAPIRRRIAYVLQQVIERQLRRPQKTTWDQAYRAILVMDKIPQGRIVGEEELFLSSDEETAYQAALSYAGFGHFENPIGFYYKNPLRGRHIVIEGPEGTGKTTIVKALSEILKTWGYVVAIPTNYGLRQDIRDIESERQELIPEPSRGLYFAHAMQQTTVTGNAHTLRGTRYISIGERGLASVPMHYEMYCKGDPTIPLLLRKHLPRIPPDLTIILGIENEDINWRRMKQDGDLANSERTPEQLEFQRKYYSTLKEGPLTGKICCIENPGTDGTLDHVIGKVLTAIELHCGIPTSR